MQKVKVFKSGNSQAIRIPKELAVKEDELIIQKVGSSMILSAPSDLWNTFEESFDSFSSDFMVHEREQPSAQEREDF